MEEKKEEFLKRGEIRTMQKDIIRLQEGEFLVEREKIARVKTVEEAEEEKRRLEKMKVSEEEREKAGEEAEIRKEIVRKAIEEEKMRKEAEEKKMTEKILEEKRAVIKESWQKEEEEREKLLERLRIKELSEEEKEFPEKGGLAEEILIPRPIIRKPPLLEKIFIRVIILLIILGVAGLFIAFGYWYSKVRKVPAPPAPAPPTVETPPAQLEIVIPPSLISVETTKTLEILNPEELPNLISQVFKEELPKYQFTRILIKDTKENKILSLKDFFGILQVKVPANIYQRLKTDESFLFLYSQEEGKRLGFIVKIGEKAGLTENLKSWEPTMEKDFESIFSLMGKEKPALTPYFKNSSYKGVSLRFQTFSRQDLGICYSIYEDYFIFTGSWESIKKVITKLTEAG